MGCGTSQPTGSSAAVRYEAPRNGKVARRPSLKRQQQQQQERKAATPAPALATAGSRPLISSNSNSNLGGAGGPESGGNMRLHMRSPSSTSDVFPAELIAYASSPKSSNHNSDGLDGRVMSPVSFREERKHVFLHRTRSDLGPGQERTLLDVIRDSIIGDNEVMDGPFGPRRVVYCDYTASGRPISFIEDYIRNEVMPMYANTHTEASGTGLQTSAFREEAREIVLECVNGNKEEDVVIFCGSGATGAIKKLVDILQVFVPPDLVRRYPSMGKIPPKERPLVLIGPFEHHSNELMWRESLVDVFEVPEDENGRLDLRVLEEMLVEFKDRPLKIGSFSAASNVTGIMVDTDKVADLLHKHGALSLWDYAAAAPYVNIDMSNKDAIFISPHKFPGGPQTPGVLVAKRSIIHNTVPTTPGGGTVYFVTSKEHDYLPDIEHREEGGTPAIIESIRCGLVFQLKRAVGAQRIEQLEEMHLRRALERWTRHPNIKVLGNTSIERISIISMQISHRQGRLHHNFVVSLLNDLFGIQARGGCSCAGPYGIRLLNIDDETALKLRKFMQKGFEILKPGWVRVNFNYFFSDALVDYIIDAVEFVADHGFKFLPYYDVDFRDALYRHRLRRQRPDVRKLSDIKFDFDTGNITYTRQHRFAEESVFAEYLQDAHRLAEEAVNEWQGWLRKPPKFYTREMEELNYLIMAHQVLEELQRDDEDDGLGGAEEEEEG